MCVVQSICKGNKLFVPSVIPSLIASNKQNRTPSRIKSIKYAVGPPSMLDYKFFHVRMLRRVDNVRMWTPKQWSELLQFALTSSCSASLRLSHQFSNSSVYSTSHST